MKDKDLYLIRDIVIEQIKKENMNNLIYILKQLEDRKFKEADEYTKLQYEWIQIQELYKEINEIAETIKEGDI